MKHPTHGQNGWILQEYDWDESTGEASFIYERYLNGSREECRFTKDQTLYWVRPELREIYLDEYLD